MKFYHAIGIVGGAGPVASAHLLQTILQICQKRFQSNDYHEFPEIILDSFPFMRGNREKIRQEIALCLSRLKNAGASLFCIASHSFHGYLPPLPEKGFVNLLHETMAAASQSAIQKAYILAAPAAIKQKLYEKAPLQCFYPSSEDQSLVSQVIREIAGGNTNQEQGLLIEKLVSKALLRFPIDGVIVACSELSILYQQFPFSKKTVVVDAMEALADKLINLSLSQ